MSRIKIKSFRSAHTETFFYILLSIIQQTKIVE